MQISSDYNLLTNGWNKYIWKLTLNNLQCILQELWQLRERITESLLSDGYIYKYDISLPLSHYYDVVEVMRNRLQGRVTRVIAYGHVGDGTSGSCFKL